MATVISDSL